MGNCCIIKLTRIIQIGDLYNPGWDKNKNVQSLMLKFVSGSLSVKCSVPMMLTKVLQAQIQVG